MNTIEPPVLAKEDLRLQQRAQRLAKRISDTTQLDSTEWLTFKLGDNIYALDSCWLVAVGAYRQMTPLTLHGGVVRGVINWQGSILGIVDLQPALGQSPSDIALASGGLLVLGRQHAEWGLPVNQILDLLPVSAVELQQCRLVKTQSGQDELMVGRLPSGVWLLNGQAVLTRMDKLVGR